MDNYDYNTRITTRIINGGYIYIYVYIYIEQWKGKNGLSPRLHVFDDIWCIFVCKLFWKSQLAISSHCCFLRRLFVSRTIVDHMVWSFLALRHSWSRAVGCCSAWLVKWLVDWDSLFAVRKLFTPQCATSNNKPPIWKWFAEPIWSSGWFIIGTT